MIGIAENWENKICQKISPLWNWNYQVNQLTLNIMAFVENSTKNSSSIDKIKKKTKLPGE